MGVAGEEGQVAVIDGAKRCSNDPRTHPPPIDVNGEQICNTSCSTITANSYCSLLLFYTPNMTMSWAIQFVSEL